MAGLAGLASLAVLTLVACGCSAEFDPSSRVTGLRVLAVKADSPYASPGSTVQLTALAVDPAGRPLQWGWGTCVDPISSQVADCIDAVDWSTFEIEPDAPDHAVTIPPDAIDRMPASARARASVGVVTVVCPGDLSVNSPALSIYATGALPFTCRDPATGRALGTDEYVAGVKRILVRDTDRNANPTIAGLTWDGKDWPDSTIQSASPCSTDGNDQAECDDSLLHAVSAVAAPGSEEKGVDSFGVSFDEQVVVEYYATEGIFADDVRIASDPVTKWIARKESAGRAVTMWMVLRDDRGGVDWATRTVMVGP
ncbi:MAG TPA: hypothetical protein VH044_18200 [Polyangiaceae bacterium]|nr:hypothetical protein [Polyangiaceae bacterium]